MTKPLRSMYGYVPGGHACPACGKKCWPSRADAKLIARRTRNDSNRRGHLGVYRCPNNSDWWHVGHLPTAVARGTSTRDDIHPTPPQPTNPNRKDPAA